MIEVAISPVHAGDADLKVCLTNSGPHECLNVIFVIRLPAGVMRLRGQERIGPIWLPPGKTVCEQLRVRAERPGRYRLTSPNFSYQDHNGKPHREASFTAEIIVEPAPAPAPEPRISTELQTRELALGEWTVLRCRLSNVGGSDAEKLELALDGQVTVDERSRRFALDRLAAGATADASFYVRAQEAGPHVPLYFDLTYSGPRGRHPDRTLATVSVSGNPTPAPGFSPPTGELIKVLYLAANPVDPADPGRRGLRVEDEFRAIQQAVSQGRKRDDIRLESRWAVQSLDITQALSSVEPHVVHFAGHGDAKEESIVVGDEYGYIHTIPVDGLVQAFQAVGQSVRCVVVNACSTERLAQALAATGLSVIGMRQPVGDHSAVRFSIGFYQALADGRSVETAFGSGVAQLMMTPLGDDARAPFLLSGGQAARG
ncbi:CHAT domain-containing protein [Trebonia kvetii]|nr:CHAT domain-containing protein [Trebonia kvetii]